MRLFNRKSGKSSESQSKLTGSRAGKARGTATSKGSFFEPLEPRQMFSAASSIAAEYASTASEHDAYGSVVKSLLGNPTSGLVAVPGIAGASMVSYHNNGEILYSPSTGAHVVYGAIGAEYANLTHETDAYGRNAQVVIGLPTSDETNIPGVTTTARQNTFQNGVIEWSPSTGAHAVYGGIGSERSYLAHETDAYGRNAQLVLGLPTSDETNIPGVSGARKNTFQNGVIEWSPSTGAHVVYGGIASEFAALAHETDAYGSNAQLVLGLPTSDETNIPGVSGTARKNTFQNGVIEWSPTTGAHAVYGGIASEFAALAHETDAYGNNAQLVLGLPTSDETNISGISGTARKNTFQNGVIEWSPSTGAHVVYGGIGSEFAALAHETDAYGNNVQLLLGLPTSDETNIPGVAGVARQNSFQHGLIYWSPSTGAHVVYGGIGSLYLSMGGATSWLGMPTSDESGSTDDRVVFFQDGFITWSPTSGAIAD